MIVFKVIGTKSIGFFFKSSQKWTDNFNMSVLPGRNLIPNVMMRHEEKYDFKFINLYSIRSSTNSKYEFWKADYKLNPT